MVFLSRRGGGVVSGIVTGIVAGIIGKRGYHESVG